MKTILNINSGEIVYSVDGIVVTIEHKISVEPDPLECSANGSTGHHWTFGIDEYGRDINFCKWCGETR